MEKRKICCACCKLNPGQPAHTLIIILIELPWLIGKGGRPQQMNYLREVQRNNDIVSMPCNKNFIAVTKNETIQFLMLHI